MIPRNIFEGTIMYTVYWTNHGFKSEDAFDTITQALDYGKSKGSEFSILDSNGATVAYLTTSGGVHYTPGVKEE